MFWGIISQFADIFGIISFVLTIALMIKSDSIKKEIAQQKTDYKKRQTEIVSSLIALRDNVWKDNLTSLPIRSKIRSELFTYRQQYGKILSLKDHWNLLLCIRTLDKPIQENKKEALCKYIDYLIGRFNKKEAQK